MDPPNEQQSLSAALRTTLAERPKIRSVARPMANSMRSGEKNPSARWKGFCSILRPSATRGIS